MLRTIPSCSFSISPYSSAAVRGCGCRIGIPPLSLPALECSGGLKGAGILGRRLRDEERLPPGGDKGRGGGPMETDTGREGTRGEGYEVGGMAFGEDGGRLEVEFVELEDVSRMPLRSGAIMTMLSL